MTSVYALRVVMALIALPTVTPKRAEAGTIHKKLKPKTW